MLPLAPRGVNDMPRMVSRQSRNVTGFGKVEVSPQMTFR